MRKQTIERRKKSDEQKRKQWAEEKKRAKARTPLKKGYSTRQIIKKTKVSNGTVMRIKKADKRDNISPMKSFRRLVEEIRKNWTNRMRNTSVNS